ncbi:MAG: hypothetical protein KC729_18965 [Candidatus Eisenbacteria bacterium]|uniref:Uncharacterized protein n=1 Tax=Eiseniibacteriota bacterium TaxID=2212470 RepID=A0A956M439_UNCEI|nr:hypothetical protein [Candidatus Eisenbacteria bacterium]
MIGVSRTWWTFGLVAVTGAVALVVAGAGTVAVAASDSSRIVPRNTEMIQLQVGTKLSSYHVTSRTAPIELSVKGPASLRILSRRLFASEPPEGPIPYGICLEIDGVRTRTLQESSDGESFAYAEDGMAAGSLERAVVQIREGHHKIRLYPAEDDVRLALRLFRGKGKAPKLHYVPFAPDTYKESALLHSADSEVTYYRFDLEVPITFSVNGPVRMKAWTRLDFDHERGASKTYAIKVGIDGALVQSQQLTSRASATSIYPGLPEITPGVGKEVIFDVPEGHHEVSIGLDCTTAAAASLRLLIPRKAITNGL